ncbi:endonuclease/exonuclease/phosphatase family protein [Roseateles sp. NT4]|uniref:endonuclease/exonuclease/phosphatase family protein n=1 Tax=Roseateles sp. NT4 TaxID=3453715 RepID=UPI003EEC0CA4
MMNSTCARACTILAAAALAFYSQSARAAPLRIVTWNLGWHVSQAELTGWTAQCSKSFVKNPANLVWEVVSADAPGAMPGWSITESRAKLEGVDLSVQPPCGVYQDPARKGIAVTSAAYIKRDAQIARMLANDVRPDVIALQEVSGTQAVQEALGAAASDYNVCSFDGQYKVQRLAFAWRKTLGMAVEPCAAVKPMALPFLPAEFQVRPGYTVTLRLNGKAVRFLTVHLKSGCVSPLERGKLDQNAGADDPCPILQQQVAPLEEEFEQLARGVDHFVVLGDFNRNLWHEANLVKGAEAVRGDGSTDLTKPRAGKVLTRNLLLEVNDGAPPESKAVLLAPTCGGDPAVAAACEAAKSGLLDASQRKVLTAKTGLGCRNPVGLDHIIVSQSLAGAVRSTSKVPIGALGASLSPKPPSLPDPLLAVSDHCPLVADIEL